MNTMRLSLGNPAAPRVRLIYTAKTHTTGARDGGSSLSNDGRLDVRFSLPSGPDDGTNPEQLFAAAWSGCFLNALKNVAAGMNVEFPLSPVIDAEVDLLEGENGCFLQARLKVNLPCIARAVALSLLEGARQTCPYSKAIEGNITTEIILA